MRTLIAVKNVCLCPTRQRNRAFQETLCHKYKPKDRKKLLLNSQWAYERPHQDSHKSKYCKIRHDTSHAIQLFQQEKVDL